MCGLFFISVCASGLSCCSIEHSCFKSLAGGNCKLSQHFSKLCCGLFVRSYVLFRSQPLTPLDSPAKEEATRGAVVIYSALRDPTDKKVRVLMDAQHWVINNLGCHFSKGGVTPPLYGHGEGEVSADTSRSAVYDQPRIYNGWMLECTDPGAEYHELILRLHEWPETDLLVALVRISVVETEVSSELGICLSSFYTSESGIQAWVEDNMRSGVGQIHVYYVNTDVHPSMQGLQTLLGVTSRKSEGSWDRFHPIALPLVRYYGYAPPLHTYLFSQRTMLNECLYRTKHMHKYVLVIDSDEFMSSLSGAPKDLAQIISQQLKEDSASLAFTRLYYPYCQINAKHKGKLPRGRSITEEAVFFKDTGIFWNQPKYVYVPSRVHSIHQHGVLAAKSDYRCLDIARPESLFIKHVRKKNYEDWGGEYKNWTCPSSEGDWTGFVKDTDETAFKQYINREMGPIGQEKWPTWLWWSQEGCYHQ